MEPCSVSVGLAGACGGGLTLQAKHEAVAGMPLESSLRIRLWLANGCCDKNCAVVHVVQT